MTETSDFTASDGIRLAYYIDDFTDPWRRPDTVLLLHAAMGSSRRYYGWVPHLARDWRGGRVGLRGHGAPQGPPPHQPPLLAPLGALGSQPLHHLWPRRPAY